VKTTQLGDLYSHYRGKLDVRAVLDHYGAQNVSETIEGDGTTGLVHSCLLDRVEPHHAHGDQHPSAYANVDKGLYICYNYWGGDIFHFIAKMEGDIDFAEIGPKLSDFFVGGTRSSVKFRKELDQLFAEPVYSVNLPSYSEKVLDAWRGDVQHPYWFAQRGISHETIGDLKLGWDRSENRIVFPHFFDGKLVGWQKRVIPAPAPDLTWTWPVTTPAWPKYKNSSGFPKSETLYAWNPEHKVVTVVESPMSVAKAWSLKLKGVVATFGAKVAKAQINLLRDAETVIVYFDDDAAGVRGCHKIVSALYRHTEVMVVNPDKGKDLGDCQTYDEAIAKISSAVPAALWLANYQEPT